MVVSSKQLSANRRNALRSSGPKTELGKAVSAQNARKHGLLAEEVIASHEDKDAFVTLVAQLFEELDPHSALEEHLVQQLAVALWRERRLAIAERVAMESEIALHAKISFGPGSLRESKGILKINDYLLFGRYQMLSDNDHQSNSEDNRLAP
jgi:predicted NUDIX family phosphoesterase